MDNRKSSPCTHGVAHAYESSFREGDQSFAGRIERRRSRPDSGSEERALSPPQASASSDPSAAAAALRTLSLFRSEQRTLDRDPPFRPPKRPDRWRALLNLS